MDLQYTLEDFKTLLWQHEQAAILLNRRVAELENQNQALRAELAKRDDAKKTEG